MTENRRSTRALVLGAVMTALVVLLQYMGAFIKLGPFSITLVLIPIVIGASICGVWTGGWLGFVFALMVFVTGDAAAFLAVNVPGTIITVFAKGILCGLCAGAVYKLFSRRSQTVAVFAAAIVCPLVNTGVFLLGCLAFFMDTIASWAATAGLGGSVGQYMIYGLVGANFLVELGVNIVLSPVVTRLLSIRKKQI